MRVFALLSFLVFIYGCSDIGEELSTPIITINSPLNFTGQNAILYDTLCGPKGSRYEFQVSYFNNSRLPIIEPGLSFDGSGSGSEQSSLMTGKRLDLFYQPDTEGTHPIIIFWNTNQCGYFPRLKVIIFLYVKHQTVLPV